MPSRPHGANGAPFGIGFADTTGEPGRVERPEMASATALNSGRSRDPARRYFGPLNAWSKAHDRTAGRPQRPRRSHVSILPIRFGRAARFRPALPGRRRLRPGPLHRRGAAHQGPGPVRPPRRRPARAGRPGRRGLAHRNHLLPLAGQGLRRRGLHRHYLQLRQQPVPGGRRLVQARRRRGGAGRGRSGSVRRKRSSGRRRSSRSASASTAPTWPT